jgi:hypothetical protein
VPQVKTSAASLVVGAPKSARDSLFAVPSGRYSLADFYHSSVQRIRYRPRRRCETTCQRSGMSRPGATLKPLRRAATPAGIAASSDRDADEVFD